MIAQKFLINLSLAVGVCVALFASIYSPLLPAAHTQIPGHSDYWRGGIDEKVSHVSKQLDSLSSKLDGLCDDLTKVKVRMAETASLYGFLSALGTYFLGLVGKGIFEKVRKK